MVKDQNRIFIGGIPAETKTETVQAVFSQFGNITDVHKPVSKGIAFVSYSTKEEMDAAIAAMDGKAVDENLQLIEKSDAEESESQQVKAETGRFPRVDGEFRISVNVARPREDRPFNSNGGNRGGYNKPYGNRDGGYNRGGNDGYGRGRDNGGSNWNNDNY